MFSLRPLAILFHFFLLVLVSIISCARAQSNITVEDSDANIEFGGEWEMKLEPTDNGGSHKVSWGTENTYVLFKFNGTAYYLMSAKWPYDVSCVVVLDGGPAMRVDMTDHASPYDETEKGSPTIASHVVAFMTGLDPDVEHEIRIEPFPGSHRTVFDALVYTSRPSVTNAESPSTSTPIEVKLRPSDTPAPTSAVPITVGISTGVTLCILLVLLLLYRCRRRRQNKQDKSKSSCMNSSDIFSPSHRTRIKLDDLEAPLPWPSWHNLPSGPAAAHQHQQSLDSMYTSLSNPVNHLPIPLTAEPASYHIHNQPAIPFATLSRPNARSVSIPLFPPPPPPSTPDSIELNYLSDTKGTDYQERPPPYVSRVSKMPRQSTVPRYSTDSQIVPPVLKRSSIGKPPVLTLSHERRREDRGSTFSDLMSSSVGSTI